MGRHDDQIAPLGALIEDDAAATTVLELLGAESKQSRALHALAEQAIHRGIDCAIVLANACQARSHPYPRRRTDRVQFASADATLGLNWDHPQTRIAYRRAEGVSFSKPASRARQASSRSAVHALVTALAALGSVTEGRQQRPAAAGGRFDRWARSATGGGRGGLHR